MSIDAAIDLLRSTTGGIYQFPNGITDITEGITLDYRDATGDVHADPRNVKIRGETMGTSVLRNLTTGPAITIIGDDAASNGWGAIVYSGVEGLTFSGGRGLRAQEIAFTNFKDLMFRNCIVGMDLESVLSCEFERIYATGGVNAVQFYKGGGFSDHNANKYRSCEFRLGTGVAMSGGPSSGLWCDDLTIQGWGTHGNLNTGGMDLTFSGEEGGVGLDLSSAYFELNGGGFDIRLTNLGARMVTHTITGANFNRISQAKHVKNNIVLAGGPQRLRLIGCNFDHYGDYVPSPDRQKIAYNPAVHQIIFDDGTYFGSPIDSVGLINKVSRNFRITSDGQFYGPAGWYMVKLSTGVFRVVHNLGVNPIYYCTQATISDVNSGFVLHTAPAPNHVDIVTGMNFTTPADRGISGQISIL